jgi:sec-independent protein translocase protein TatB
MFDFDVGKLLVFGIIAIAVIPPKDLPRVMRTVGQYVGKMRRMAAEFQGQFMEAMREADLDSVKKEIESINAAAKIDSTFDPVMAMRTEMTHAIEPPKAEVTVSEIASTPLPAAAEKTPPAPADAEKAAAS